jgi:hypothetical protein
MCFFHDRLVSHGDVKGLADIDSNAPHQGAHKACPQNLSVPNIPAAEYKLATLPRRPKVCSSSTSSRSHTK